MARKDQTEPTDTAGDTGTAKAGEGLRLAKRGPAQDTYPERSDEEAQRGVENDENVSAIHAPSWEDEGYVDVARLSD